MSTIHIVARLQLELTATQRELERWKHGQQIEGDYVCPDSLEVGRLRSLLVEACDVGSHALRTSLCAGTVSPALARLSQIRALAEGEGK